MFRSLDTFASTASVLHEASLCPPLLISRNLRLYNDWLISEGRLASLARFLFTTLLSAENERSKLIGYFFFTNGGTSAQLSPDLPSPSLLYHLAVVIISADSAHSRFAIEKRRFPTSVACYDITAVKLQTNFET